MTEARLIASAVSDGSLLSTIRRPSQCRHLGAALTECVLQAGLNYESVVLPRIRLLVRDYPGSRTLSGFIRDMSEHSLQAMIQWRNEVKLARVGRLVWHMTEVGVETVSDLSLHLRSPGVREPLLALHGIGPKSIDYLQSLCGVQSIAIDRHLRAFAISVGVRNLGYQDLASSYRDAADILGVDLITLDRTVWTFMSKRHSRVDRRSLGSACKL